MRGGVVEPPARRDAEERHCAGGRLGKRKNMKEMGDLMLRMVCTVWSVAPSTFIPLHAAPHNEVKANTTVMRIMHDVAFIVVALLDFDRSEQLCQSLALWRVFHAGGSEHSWCNTT